MNSKNKYGQKTDSNNDTNSDSLGCSACLHYIGKKDELHCYYIFFYDLEMKGLSNTKNLNNFSFEDKNKKTKSFEIVSNDISYMEDINENGNNAILTIFITKMKDFIGDFCKNNDFQPIYIYVNERKFECQLNLNIQENNNFSIVLDRFVFFNMNLTRMPDIEAVCCLGDFEDAKSHFVVDREEFSEFENAQNSIIMSFLFFFELKSSNYIYLVDANKKFWPFCRKKSDIEKINFRIEESNFTVEKKSDLGNKDSFDDKNIMKFEVSVAKENKN